MNPKVSIITVNYNGFSDTCELIESLKKYITFSYEIVVVDNASVQNEAAKLQDIYPYTTCIRSEKNLGFAGGNNVGIKVAKGEYILLLNNDTYVTDSSLEDLISILENNPKIGAVSPKIKFASIPDEIQFAGYTNLSAITLRNQTIGYAEKDKGQYNQPLLTHYLHGAAMMVKRTAIEKAGLMPELYFLYYEELDWCQHIKDAGYELWFQPSALVYHKEGKSVGQKSPLKILYMTRNRLLYAWRNCKGIRRYLTIIYQLTIALPKNTLVYLFSGRTDLAKASVKGAFKFFSIKNKMVEYKYEEI